MAPKRFAKRARTDDDGENDASGFNNVLEIDVCTKIFVTHSRP